MALSSVQTTERYLWGFSTVFLLLAYVLSIWSLSIAKNYTLDKCEYDDHHHILVSDTFKLGTENVTFSYSIEPTVSLNTFWISILAALNIIVSLGSFPFYSPNKWTRIQMNRIRLLSIYIILSIFIPNILYFVLPLTVNSETASYNVIHSVEVPHYNFSVNSYFGGKMLTLFSNKISYSRAEELCELNHDFHLYDMRLGNNTVDHTLGSCAYAPEDKYLQLSYSAHPTHECSEVLWTHYKSISGWAVVFAVIEIIIIFAWFFVHERENIALIKKCSEEQQREVNETRTVADLEQGQQKATCDNTRLT